MNQVTVKFVSKWKDGDDETSAMLNLDTGEVTDIDASYNEDEYGNMISQVIELGHIVSEPLEMNAQNDVYLNDVDSLNKFRVAVGLDPLWHQDFEARRFQCTFIDTPASIRLQGDPTKVALTIDYFRKNLKYGITEIKGRFDENVLNLIYLDGKGERMDEAEVDEILENFESNFIKITHQGFTIGHESHSGDEIFLSLDYADMPKMPMIVSGMDNYVTATPFDDRDGNRGMLILDVIADSAGASVLIGLKAAQGMPHVQLAHIGEAALESNLRRQAKPRM